MNRLIFVAVAAAALAVRARAQQLDFDARALGSPSLHALLQAAPAGAEPKAAPVAAPAPAAAAVCAIEVVDALNKTDAVFTVASSAGEKGATLYRVSDGRSTEETVVRADDAAIETHNGVPHSTPAKISADYKDGAEAVSRAGKFQTPNGQLTFTVKPGSRCAPFDAALLMFWIDEWFYFG